jgi:hypothetical protein
MGVSRNRKKHATKVAAYKQKIVGEKKRAQEALMKLYQEQMQAKNKMKEHVSGVDVENTDIDVDIDLDDLSVPTEEITDTVVDVEDFTIVEEEPKEEK